MKLKDFNNYKITNIKGQVVKKKSPWPKLLSSALVTAGIIFVLMSVKPNFAGWSVFTERLSNFFKYDPIKVGIVDTTISDTLMLALNLLWKTIMFSVLGTIFGIIISIPMALLSSKAIVKKWYVYTPFRIMMSLFRSIPPLIIAFLMFNVFSKTLSATLALTIFVTTIMTKWLYEEIDSIDLSAFDSLQSLGVSKNRAITKSVFPYLMRSIVSYGIYAFEMVIRFATILGVVGITTIGSLLSDKYQSPLRWGHMAIVLFVLILTIIIIEFTTILFKKYILGHKPKQITLDEKMNKKYLVADTQNKSPKFWIYKLILSIFLIGLIVYAITTVQWHIASQTKLDSFSKGMKDLFHPNWTFINKFGTGVNALELGLKALLVAVAGSIFGLVLSFVFGILAAKNFTGKYLSWLFRIIIIIIRSIPAFVYAIIFMFLSPQPKLIFAGVLALGIHSIGMLGKLTYEKIDSIDIGSRQALEVMGSSRIISTRWALLQEALPTLISNAIYRIEINFKSTVEIGAVGASAFGFQIAIYSADPNLFSWLAPYLIVTMGIVLTLEQISNLLRKKIMKGYFISKNNFISKRLRKYSEIRAISFAEAFQLDFKRNEEVIKFNNYVGRKMLRSKSNKKLFKDEKRNILNEIQNIGHNSVVQKYSS